MMLEKHEPSWPIWFVAAGGDDDEQPNELSRPPAIQSRRLRVLVVEDEFFISLTARRMLEALGHVVVGIAVSADEAVKVAEAERPDVVLMDIRLVGLRDGVDAAEEIHRRFGIGSIFVSANSDPATRERAKVVSPLGFIEKPLTENRLRVGLSALTSK